MALGPVIGVALQLLAAVSPDSARIVGKQLVVEPLGVAFTIPPGWLGMPDTTKRDRLCANTPEGRVADRIKVNRKRFASLQNAKGEWRREYSAVVDSMLPFRSLVAHLGGDPWDGHCNAIQMRVYVGAFPEERMTAQSVVGMEVASRYFRPAHRDVSTEGGWTRVHLSWYAHYGDYGGTAHVETWSRLVKDRFVILVFMFAPGSEWQRADITDILASFQQLPERSPVRARPGR